MFPQFLRVAFGLTLGVVSTATATSLTTTDARSDLAGKMGGHIVQAWKTTLKIDGRYQTYLAVVRKMSPELPFQLDVLRQFHQIYERPLPNTAAAAKFVISETNMPHLIRTILLEEGFQPSQLIFTSLDSNGIPEVFWHFMTCGNAACSRSVHLMDLQNLNEYSLDLPSDLPDSRDISVAYLYRQSQIADFFLDIEQHHFGLPAALDWYEVMEAAKAHPKGFVQSRPLVLPGCSVPRWSINQTVMIGSQKYLSTFTGGVFLLDSKKCTVQLIYHTDSWNEWIGGLKAVDGQLQILDGFTRKRIATYYPSRKALQFQ